jgi:hypothetical protein
VKRVVLAIALAACGGKEPAPSKPAPEPESASSCEARVDALAAELEATRGRRGLRGVLEEDLPLAEDAAPITAPSHALVFRGGTVVFEGSPELGAYEVGTDPEVRAEILDELASRLAEHGGTPPYPLHVVAPATVTDAELAAQHAKAAHLFELRRVVRRPDDRRRFPLDRDATESVRSFLTAYSIEPAQAVAEAAHASIASCPELVHAFDDDVADFEELLELRRTRFVEQLRRCGCERIDLPLARAWMLVFFEADRPPLGWVSLSASAAP